MPGTSTWRDVRAKRAAREPDLEKGVERELDIARAEMALAQLRRRRHMSQGALAAALAITQPAVSKADRSDLGDMQLKTIRGYVGALGGRIEVRAVFDDETVTIA